MQNNTLEYIPYTYLIGWSKLKLWYYGVEYAQNGRRVANPANLWVTYFTSSKFVSDTIERYGQPDIIEVRRTFDSAKNAVCWELEVLRRLGVTKSDKWLNKHHGVHNFDVHGQNNPNYGKVMSPETRTKISRKALGRVCSAETREKLRIGSTGRSHSEETRSLMSTVQKQRACSPNHPFKTEQSRNRASERRKGKTFEEVFGDKARDIKDKMSSAKKGKEPWNKGRAMTTEVRAAMSAAQKGKPRPYMKGMVSSVDPEGNLVRLSKQEFDSRHDLVGIMSAEGKRRRSLKMLSRPPTDG